AVDERDNYMFFPPKLPLDVVELRWVEQPPVLPEFKEAEHIRPLLGCIQPVFLQAALPRPFDSGCYHLESRIAQFVVVRDPGVSLKQDIGTFFEKLALGRVQRRATVDRVDRR